jgi:hypothetical protein
MLRQLLWQWLPPVITILCNLYFLDVLFWGNQKGWLPFLINPKKWLQSFSDAPPPSTEVVRRGNSFLDTSYTGDVYETDEEYNRRKREKMQKIALDKHLDNVYIKSLEQQLQERISNESRWREHVRIAGFIVTVVNLLFFCWLAKEPAPQDYYPKKETQEKREAPLNKK